MTKGSVKERRVVGAFFFFLAVCGLGLAYGFFKIAVGIAGEIPKLGATPFRVTMIDVYLEVLLQRLVFAWILWQLGRLVRRVARGEPFDAAIPGLIRKIALAPVAWGLLEIAHDLYYSPVRPLTIRDLAGYVYGSVGRLALFAAALLIVAQVFERAAAMKREADLTV